MLAKEYSLQIEILLRSVNSSMNQKSDEILSNPYKAIITAVEYRVPQKN